MATKKGGKKAADQVRGGPACREQKDQSIINGDAHVRPIDSRLLLGISLAAFTEEG